MARIRRIVVRFVAVWLIEAFSLSLMTGIIPGISFVDTPTTPGAVTALLAALVLGAMNALVRPLILLLTLPLDVFTLGAFTLLINSALIFATGNLLPGLLVANFASAIWGSITLAIANTFLTSLTTIDDDHSFFEGVVERLSARRRVPGVSEPGRGLVLLEIDGLSYGRLRRAVERGLMPTVRQMLREDHRLTGFDCGLPSQTSACQAGIMYGDNYDIPAFRWYDKERGKLIASSNFRDAAELAARYATGRGLLRGGSSINNLLSGDADKTLLTLSALSDGGQDTAAHRWEDLYLFWLNPYLFTRSVVLTVWDVLVELGQTVRQRVRNVQPRINRLERGYPLLRAITNVFLRDLGTYMAMMDVIRGAPAIYVTYIGYDEVAHHAGPDSADALNTLRAIDGQIRRVRDLIARKATRPYDLIVLSDHGQAFGATFRQRYGQTLAQFIDGQVRPEVDVVDVHAGAAGESYAAALVAELHGAERHITKGRIRRATMSRTRRALANRLARHASPIAVMDARVRVCVSGNLANVYFDLSGGKVGLNELNAAHPGLVDALIRHDGIGFVVTYGDDGAPIVLGKDGARDLRAGVVTGVDPLSRFGDPDFRATQVARLAEFPHSGDLIINSALYDGDRIAAFEELIGSHGGLGGEQTDAFVLHPADMSIPVTSNAVDLFAVFDARRGLLDVSHH